MFITADKKVKIASVVFGIACLIVFFYLEYIGVLSEGTGIWLFVVVESIFDMLFPDEIDNSLRKRKRNAMFYLNVIRKENMFGDSLNNLLGKEVKIRTLDETVSGIVKNVDGDFLIVEKNKKNTTETVYVNKNTVETVKIVKQK